MVWEGEVGTERYKWVWEGGGVRLNGKDSLCPMSFRLQRWEGEQKPEFEYPKRVPWPPSTPQVPWWHLAKEPSKISGCHL